MEILTDYKQSKCKNESERTMKIMYRTVAIVSVALVFTTGCVNPNGTQNNTGSGALIGGALGAITGAVIGHNNGNTGAGALIGAAAGVIAGGLIGNMIDQQQQQQLQQQYPQTWNKLQNNDAVYANSPSSPAPPTVAPPPSTSPEATAPPPSTLPAVTAPTPSTPTTTTTPQMQPLTVDDIKALAAAGVRPDAINKEIDISQSTFSQSDIAAAQQANVNSEVIAHMQSHPS